MEIKNVKLIFDGKIADNAVDITVETEKFQRFQRRAKSLRRDTLRCPTSIFTRTAR